MQKVIKNINISLAISIGFLFEKSIPRSNILFVLAFSIFYFPKPIFLFFLFILEISLNLSLFSFKYASLSLLYFASFFNFK